MGFHDRGYASRGSALGFEWTAVAGLLVANVVVFLANMLGPAPPHSLNELLALHGDLVWQPWRAWELVTYGFAHEPLNPRQQLPWHILGNMLTLWFFGRAVEDAIGRAEFLRFYVAALVVAGLAWLASVALVPGGGGAAQLIGASGAVTAVLAVFIWRYPHQTVLLWGILPVPAWVLGVLFVIWDVQGATARTSNVAHVAHLAGAAFGLLYAWRGWSFAGLSDLTSRLTAWRRRRGSALRVHRPDDGDDEASLQEQVDDILAKISRSGSASLTAAERDTLHRASRRLKDRARTS